MLRTALSAFLAAALAISATPGARAERLLAQGTPPASPQATAAVFYFDDGGKPSAPLSLRELREKVASGAVGPDTLVWKSGMPDWAAAKQVAELAPLFASGEMDFAKLLVGTWDIGSAGGQGPAKARIMVQAGGMLSGQVFDAGSQALSMTGAWVARSTGEKRFDWTITMEIERPGRPLAEQVTETAHLEIVDNDTLRDVEDGSLTKRVTAAAPAPVAAPAPAPAPASPIVAPAQMGCGGKPLLTDDFRQVDPTWATDPDSGAVTVEDGKVKIKSKPNAGYTVLYGGLLFDEADVCVTVQNPNNADKAGTVAAGLVFWGLDYSNYYNFSVTPDGRAAIFRHVRGRWVPILAFRKADGVNDKPGAKNMLRVSTKGDTIDAFINGVPFATVRGQPPDGGGEVGLHADSEEAHRDTWKFTGFKVTAPTR